MVRSRQWWLNQVEIYFPILKRKALMPNDFPSLEAVEQRLIGFQHHYERIAKPFEWKFTRDDLTRLPEKTKESGSQHDEEAQKILVAVLMNHRTWQC